jgi:hypothetical protein
MMALWHCTVRDLTKPSGVKGNWLLFINRIDDFAQAAPNIFSEVGALAIAL